MNGAAGFWVVQSVKGLTEEGLHLEGNSGVSYRGCTIFLYGVSVS